MNPAAKITDLGRRHVVDLIKAITLKTPGRNVNECTQIIRFLQK
jgi:hypothetical protein